MAQKSPAPSRRGRGLLTCVFIVGVVFICAVLVAGAGAYFMLRNAKPPNESFLTTIHLPSTGMTVRNGEPVTLQATSAYSGGVTRLDLYANGGLITTMSSTLPGGSNPLALADMWTPPTTGRIMLIARAYTRDGRHSDSAVVYLDVSKEQYHPIVNINNLPQTDGKNSSMNQIANNAGVTVGELQELNPDLSGTDPEAPLPDDTSLTMPGLPPPPGPGGTPGSPGPPVPPAPPGPTPPAAPTGLTAVLTCTQATLHWTDNSSDETNFIVYRIDPGTSTLHQVIVLPPNTTSYVDTLVGLGNYTYMVTSIRGTAELLAEPVNASTPPACVGAPPGPLDLVLTIGSLETDNAFPGIHCYAAILSASLVWERLPPGDFTGLAPTAPRLYRLSNMPNHGRYSLSHHSPTSPVNLSLVCYGRNPPIVDYIGLVNPVIPPADWNGSVRTAHSTDGLNGNYTLYYCLGPAATPCAIPGAPLPSDPTWMTDPFLPPPTNLRLENSFDGCQDLPTPLEKFVCVFSGIWTGGVPSLLWDWNGDPNYTEAELTGYHVVLRSLERHSGAAATVGEWDVLRRIDGTLPRVILDRMDRNICGLTYEYNVSAVASDRRSVESTPVMYNTPDCFQPVDVTVTFNTLQMSPVINDCGDWLLNDNTMESSGYIGGYGSANVFRVLNPEQNTAQGGNYTFNGLWGGSPTLIIPVNDVTQTVTIRTRLHDKDALFSCQNAPEYCRVDFELPARSTADWATLNTNLTGSTNNPEGGCTVGVHVQGAIRP